MNIRRVLIANRGEIAVRIIRACRVLGLETVVAVSEADRDSLPARLADRAVCIGPPSAQDSYLNIGAVIAAAEGAACDAIHPGYGFLAEVAELAEASAQYGITFVGPQPKSMRDMGNKLQARAAARRFGVPVLPGSEKVRSVTEAMAVIDAIGLPVLVKAAAGGGGRGMKVVTDKKDLQPTLQAAAAEARAAFGDDTLYIERFIANARHIEVQVLGDRSGDVIHLGERDCSLQRRHQKVVEEAPAPNITAELRQAMQQAAVDLARAIGYENAGTVEFVFDQDAGAFYFLEMNTRIQVEHPVTEAITGVDLVVEQLRIAAGRPLSRSQEQVQFSGHAIECRINAESVKDGFRPSPGLITAWQPPEGPGIRLDSHCYAGYAVPIYYDSMLAKLIVRGDDRNQALERTRQALAAFTVAGVDTTVPFLRHVLAQPEFIAAKVNTRWLEQLVAHASW